MDNISTIITKEQLYTWPEVVDITNSNNGVVVVTMETLRNIDDYGRLGVAVRASIKRKLASIGLGTIREDLPSEGASPLLIYRLGTPVSELIDLIKLIESDRGHSKDLVHICERLRSLNIMPDAEKVRKAVSTALTALNEAADAVGESNGHTA